MKPKIEDIPEFYQSYVRVLPDQDLLGLLESTRAMFSQVLGDVDDQGGAFRYQTNKWSIKEIIQHIIDGERVFTYRALRFSRGDKTDLPGFEQDDYVAAFDANSRHIDDLTGEFYRVRTSTIDFYRSLDETALSRSGTANGFPFTVNSVGHITAGHVLHHLNILTERYLPHLK